MSITKEDIIRWIENRPDGTQHMIVACDTFDWDDYPIYTKDVETEIKRVDDVNMQKVMEVYSFTGKYLIDDQLKEFRSYHLD